MEKKQIRVQDDILMCSLKTSLQSIDVLKETKKMFTDKMNELFTASPSLFETLGQVIPTSWFICINFLYKVREVGLENEEKLFKAVDDCADEQGKESLTDSHNKEEAIVVCPYIRKQVLEDLWKKYCSSKDRKGETDSQSSHLHDVLHLLEA